MSVQAETPPSVETPYDPVTLEVLWGGLISIVNEMAATLLRTAFSTIVREGDDYCIVLMDRLGRSVAQTDTVPSFIAACPVTVQHALKRWPLEEWAPGDVVVTNDPWLATGHLDDCTIITPIFRRDELIGFIASVVHAADIGGKTWGGKAYEIYEEGLHLPLLKICVEGRDVAPIWEILAANVRVPDVVLGDWRAQITANGVGVRKVVEFLDENEVADFDGLAAVIQARSEQALRAAIAEIPDGTYDYSHTADAAGTPMTIQARLTVDGSDIHVDYAGSSPQQRLPINSVPNYTYAYTAFPLKCVLSPDVPNNDGSFRPVHVTAPSGSVLNPSKAASVGSRHCVGHLLHGVLFGALAQAIPDRVNAMSGQAFFVALSGQGKHGPFSTMFACNGGMGARRNAPPHSATPYPHNASNTGVELLENQLPIVYEEQRLLRGSGGSGPHRGGDGQRVAFRIVGDAPIGLSVLTMRAEYPAEGFCGGGPGATGSVRVGAARPFNIDDINVLDPGDRVELETPGGGGFGDVRA